MATNPHGYTQAKCVSCKIRWLWSSSRPRIRVLEARCPACRGKLQRTTLQIAYPDRVLADEQKRELLP